MEHLEQFHFTEDFELENFTEHVSFLLLQGPASYQLLSKIVALEIDEIEEKIRRAVLEGMRLSDARKQFKYHQLQSKT